MTEATPEKSEPTTVDGPARMTSPSEMLRSLNGYEEQAIEDNFGRDQEELGYGRQLRALVFVSRVRGGAQPRAAYLEAMGMTMQNVLNEFELLADFGDDEDETATKSETDSTEDDDTAAEPADE